MGFNSGFKGLNRPPTQLLSEAQKLGVSQSVIAVLWHSHKTFLLGWEVVGQNFRDVPTFWRCQVLPIAW